MYGVGSFYSKFKEKWQNYIDHHIEYIFSDINVFDYFDCYFLFYIV